MFKRLRAPEPVVYTEVGVKGVNEEIRKSSIMNDELLTAIKRTIKELPDTLREAIVYREFDGLSYEEIAELMECPIGTVRSRIFRARETLEESMAPYLDGN